MQRQFISANPPEQNGQKKIRKIKSLALRKNPEQYQKLKFESFQTLLQFVYSTFSCAPNETTDTYSDKRFFPLAFVRSYTGFIDDTL